MSALVEELEKGLQAVVDDLQDEIEKLEEKVADRDRLVLAVVDHVERGLIDRDELLEIALRGGV